MILKVVRSLMVCSNKEQKYGFTYGRIYHFINDPDMYDTGYNWVKNDLGIITAAPLSSFSTLDQFKKKIKNRNMANKALIKSENYI